jgi:AraC-like DNA-binding protein
MGFPGSCVVTRPSRIHVTLDEVPDHERFDYWQRQGSLYFEPSLIDPADRPSFRMSGSMLTLGSLVLVRCGGSRQIYTRSEAHLNRDQVDLWILDVLLEGGGEVEIESDISVMEPGDLFLLDLQRPSRFRLGPHQRLTALFPRTLLHRVYPRLPDLHGASLSRTSASGRILLAYLLQLEEEGGDATAEEAEAMSAGLVALIACLFGAQVPAESEQQRLVQDIFHYLTVHLASPDLAAERVADEFGLSRSGLYRLLEPYGGIAAWIREQRLQLACRLLLRARYEGRHDLLIRDLAFGVGFTNEAHFSRLFKQRFGVTAAQLRRDGRTGRSGMASSTVSSGVSPDSEALETYYDRWLANLSPASPRL